VYTLNYVRPRTLAEAITFLRDNPEARPLSGGMTLIPTLKQRLAAPSHLVDLSGLQELMGIEEGAGAGPGPGPICIGAATVHADVACSPVVTKAIPALAHLAGMIADPQVRNRGTIGGSVANNDPAADYPAAVLALNGTIVTSERRIAAGDYFVGMFETALTPGELIVALEFPRADRAAYLKYRHPASGYATVGVFIACFGADVRVAITGAGTSVFRWREAEQRLGSCFSVDSLKDLRMDGSELLDDVHAPQAYRANLIEVYTRRAVVALAGAAK
jgi:carbon-monoxide dehydrogenase medium subunit